jgi:hexosaminidase
MVFPRIASAAEAAWSRPLGSADRDWESFRTRVAGLGRLWEADGIRFFRSPEIPWS